MKFFKKTLAALATVGALTGAGSANAYLTDWYFDANGSVNGTADAVLVPDNLSMDSSAVGYISVFATSATDFMFQETGVIRFAGANSGQAFTQTLFATYTLNGTGKFGSGTSTFDGDANFTGGTFSLWVGANTYAGTTDTYGVGPTNQTLIATFDVFGDKITGLNNIGQPVSGNATNNTQFQIVGSANWLASDYFYLPDGVTDIAGLTDALTWGFVVGNATSIAPSGNMVSEFGPQDLVLDPSNDDYTVSFFVNHGGQARLQVPEPATLALSGLALLGLGALRRRQA